MENGSQMLRVSKDIKTNEEKIKLLEGRINTLQRRDESTQKRMNHLERQK